MYQAAARHPGSPAHLVLIGAIGWISLAARILSCASLESPTRIEQANTSLTLPSLLIGQQGLQSIDHLLQLHGYDQQYWSRNSRQFLRQNFHFTLMKFDPQIA